MSTRVYRITSLQISILLYFVGALRFPLYKMPNLKIQDKLSYQKCLIPVVNTLHFVQTTCRRISILRYSPDGQTLAGYHRILLVFQHDFCLWREGCFFSIDPYLFVVARDLVDVMWRHQQNPLTLLQSATSKLRKDLGESYHLQESVNIDQYFRGRAL